MDASEIKPTIITSLWLRTCFSNHKAIPAPIYFFKFNNEKFVKSVQIQWEDHWLSEKKVFWKLLMQPYFLSMLTFMKKTSQPAFTCFKLNNRNTRTRCEICSKLIIKTPERRHWRRCGVFIIKLWTYFTPCSSVSIVDFEQVNAGWVINQWSFFRYLSFWSRTLTK